MKKLFFAFLAGIAIAVPASAAPNWLGQTGLLLIPTADSLNAGEWNAAFHHISDVSNIAAGNLGIAKGLEVGAVWFDPQHFGKSKLTADAKYTLLHETAAPAGIGLAVGWWDVFDEVNSSLYGVASKTVTKVSGHPLRVHLGFGGGVYNDNVFAGADLPLAPNFLAMVEDDGFNINGGIRWGLPSGFRIDAGFVTQQFGVGASYNAHF